MKQNKRGYWINKDGEVAITSMPSIYINNAINKAMHDGYGTHERVDELRLELKRRTLIPNNEITTLTDVISKKRELVEDKLREASLKQDALLKDLEVCEKQIEALEDEINEFEILLNYFNLKPH